MADKFYFQARRGRLQLRKFASLDLERIVQENDIDYVPWNLLDKPNLRLLLIRGNPFLIDKDDKDELRKKIDKKRTEGVVIID